MSNENKKVRKWIGDYSDKHIELTGEPLHEAEMEAINMLVKIDFDYNQDPKLVCQERINGGYSSI